MLELVVISTLNGVLYGMLLFLMASGLTVIFSMLGVLNFAHASFYMLGAFFGFQISRWIGFWPALLIAPPLVVNDRPVANEPVACSVPPLEKLMLLLPLPRPESSLIDRIPPLSKIPPE